MKTRTVNVTQRDIDLARSSDPLIPTAQSCPVARAMCRVMKKKLGYCLAGHFSLKFARNQFLDTPENVLAFEIAFDNGKDVQPFTFTVSY